MRTAWWALLWVACGGSSTWIVEGTVVEVRGEQEVVLDHDAIAGLMGPMVMPFAVSEPALVGGLEPGHRVIGRLVKGERGLVLEKLRVVGQRPVTAPTGPAVVPLRAGELLPAVQVRTPGGQTWLVGEGQGVPTVLTFVYTTCPLPEFCPATVRRLQELAATVPEARLVAVTIDLERDTLDVLAAYGESVGADPVRWRFGRVEGAATAELFGRAALTSVPGATERFEHTTRLMVLDKDGRLVERYDDNRWPLERVVGQLRGDAVGGGGSR